MEKICVAVRVRPLSTDENDQRNQWKVAENTISLYSACSTPSLPNHSFTFDHVFGTEVRNRKIYDVHTKEVIMATLSGFNGTVFAYGQTSSGKTYTMQGSADDPGLIGLAVDDIFSNIQKIVNREFLIRVSYMEIYNEDINDLLAPENRKLQIHENLERGIFVAGLREEIVNNPDQVFDLLKFGEARRHVGQTNMNVYSSRSHTIFRMVIESKGKSQDAEVTLCSDAVRVSVLNLVDLAGSERIAKTGAGGARLREGTHINKSLMILGTVIKKLSDGATKQGAHIPYRDSKLTRILQPALGGNAKTAIICTVAPEEVHIDETRGTLQFASRAKRVTTCAQVNETLSDAALLKRQKKEIEELRQKLQGSRSEVLEQQILHLRNDLLKFELEREKLSLELKEERKAQQEREQRIKEQEQKIENLSSLFISSAFEDFDQEKLAKQSNDLESVRRLSLELPMQECRRYTGKRPSEDCLFENARITVRRENLKTPPGFRLLLDRSGEKGSKSTQGTDGIVLPAEFGNVADEDMWLSLNNGQCQMEPDFLHFTTGNSVSSVESVRGRKSSFIHDAIKSSRDESDRIKSQLHDIMKEKAELQNCLQQHLVFQKQLENVIYKMEREVGSSKAVTEDLLELWDYSKQTHEYIAASLQDFITVERSLIETTINRIKKCNDVKYGTLEEKVTELEGEVLKYKQENSELKAKSQSLQDQLDSLIVSCAKEVDESCHIEGSRPRLKRKLGDREEIDYEAPGMLLPSQETCAFQISDCSLNKYCHSCLSSFALSGQFASVVDNNSSHEIQPLQRFCSHVDSSVAEINLSGMLDMKQVIVPERIVYMNKLLQSLTQLGPKINLCNLLVCLNPRSAQECEINMDCGSGGNAGDSTSEKLCIEQALHVETTSKQAQGELMSTLASAVLHGAVLLEDMHCVLDHDSGCLATHVDNHSSVGMLIKALKYLIGRNANLAFCHLQTTGASALSSLPNNCSNINQGLAFTMFDLGSKPVTRCKNQDDPHGSDDSVQLTDQKRNLLASQITRDRMVINMIKAAQKEEKIVHTRDHDILRENLQMSQEHVMALEQQLVLAKLEKESSCKALVEQLEVNEEHLLATCVEKLKFAKVLDNSMEALLFQDSFIDSICHDIKEFEKQMEQENHFSLQKIAPQFLAAV